VFPYFLLRVATLSVEDIDTLRCSGLEELTTRYYEGMYALASLREQTSAVLYDAAGRLGPGILRQAVVDLRRDLYNGREMQPERLHAVHSLLRPEEWDSVQHCYRRESEQRALGKAVVTQHETALRTTRNALRALVARPLFRKGLLLSSESLYRNVSNLGRADVKVNSRYEHIERAVLRYVTRAGRKATPFGTFCTIMVGVLEHAHTESASHRGFLIPDPVGLTRFRGHLNRSDYGSEQEVFHGQETTGL
jgi:hypothetical protein